MSSECVLALDIGGTKLAAGVVDEDGCVRGSETVIALCPRRSQHGWHSQ
jgi:predicted NBD/HSP70 family sugar kinase